MALWAGVGASQRIALPPRELAALGRKVLHLPAGTPWDPSKVKTLWRVTADAIAQGVGRVEPSCAGRVPP